MIVTQLLPRDYPRARQKRIRTELCIALDATSSSDLSSWGIRSGRVLLGAGVRRLRVAQSLGRSVAKITSREVQKVKEVSSFRKYATDRGSEMSSQFKSIVGSASQVWKSLSMYCRENPKEAAGQLALLCLGFQAGSGGIDGDGGLPDFDWTLFDSHRSLLTHSVLPAIVIEVAVLALVDLIATIHNRLPESHDPIWDTIQLGSKKLEIFSIGASLGLAYHLGIDATVDGEGSYANLPVPLPQEGHQVLAGTFSIVEGLDSMARMAKRGDVLATYSKLQFASSAIRQTTTPSSYLVKRLRNDTGFKVVWMPKQA